MLLKIKLIHNFRKDKSLAQWKYLITIVEENCRSIISSCKQWMQEQVNTAWINFVSKQTFLTLLEHSAAHPQEYWKSQGASQTKPPNKMINLLEIHILYANVYQYTKLFLNTQLLFFFFILSQQLFSCHQIKCMGVSEKIHNRKQDYIYKMIKLFLHSLIESLKILIWAEIFQITFSL